MESNQNSTPVKNSTPVIQVPSYIAGVQENIGGQAAVVFDKFHVRRVAQKHPSLLFHQMVKCAGMIERHLEGILAHCRNKTTNAFLEALNSVFSAAKQKARGFRSTDNLIAMLYFTAGKLRIPATH